MFRPILWAFCATLALLAPASAQICNTPNSASQNDKFADSGAKSRRKPETFIDKTSYEPAKRCLYVYFKDGAIFGYQGVSAATYRQFVRDSEPGSFFNTDIRNKFKSLKLHARTTPRQPKKPLLVPAPGKKHRHRTAPIPTFACTEPPVSQRRRVNSPVLDYVAYDPTNRCMILYFDHRGIYQYSKVPPATYNALVASKNVGQYFNENVRNNFVHRRSDKKQTRRRRA